jgi:predicted amidohydrolase
MSEIAKELGIVLIGGSIPESAADKLYNTCYVFGSDGAVIGKYRKRYLFDVNVKNGISFRESDVISAGDKLTVVDVEFAKIGVAICYDVRFPHLMTTMAEQGAQLIVLPASFSLSTGPYHWEILMRARALDFQLYFAACSSARNNMAKFKAYGHSMIVNPWGEICGAAAIEETVVFGEIDIDYIEQVRQEIPVRTQLVRNVTV